MSINQSTLTIEDITREDFSAYEFVRTEGLTNMFHITNVCELSGLERPVVLAIMRNYEGLMERYPDVRTQ